MMKLADLLKTISLVAALLAVVNAPASADLYGHWPLDDGEGDVARNLGPGDDGDIFDGDFLGLGDDGTVWVEDDDRGMVAGFAGAFVEAGELPMMDLENNFSWAFWAKQPEEQASPSNDIILGSRFGFGGGDTAPREFIKFTPNRFEYHMNAGFDNDLQYDLCECPERHIPSDDEWYHHAVVKNGSELAYYRDGELWNEHELLDPMYSDEPLPFNLAGQNGQETWTGYLSDVRLYDHALTEAEVADIVSGGGGGGLPGDFNNDGVLDAADIDLLTVEANAGTNNASFDLNNDALVNGADREVWVNDLRRTWFGDSNLDGIFNSSDFVSVFTAGEYEDAAAGNSTWGTGDWNGDLEFNSSDFVTAFVSGGFEQGERPAAAQAVPEPGSVLLVLMGVIALFAARRR